MQHTAYRTKISRWPPETLKRELFVSGFCTGPKPGLEVDGTRLRKVRYGPDRGKVRGGAILWSRTMTRAHGTAGIIGRIMGKRAVPSEQNPLGYDSRAAVGVTCTLHGFRGAAFGHDRVETTLPHDLVARGCMILIAGRETDPPSF